MTETLRIGELARRTGRSVHTIRWYEAQGLMPGVVRDKGRRRTYDPDHVVWLELIERLRLTGMSIADLRTYARLNLGGRASRADIREVLFAQAARTRGAIEKQREALHFIERKIRFYEEWIATGRRPTLPKPPRPRR